MDYIGAHRRVHRQHREQNRIGFWHGSLPWHRRAIVGGVIFSALGASGITGLNLYSMVVAVIGAVVVLVIYHLVRGRRAF
jgi:hypothetical protein